MKASQRPRGIPCLYGGSARRILTHIKKASMGCPECSRLSELFAEAIKKHAELRDLESAASRNVGRSKALAFEAALMQSSAEISLRRRQLLDHEASHGPHLLIPYSDGRSSVL